MQLEASKEVNKFLMELVQTLMSVIEQKDPFLSGHSNRVANRCVSFCKSMAVSGQNGFEKIYFAGLLHDIGMVYLPRDIVQKTDHVSDDERMLIQQHPVVSEKILRNLTILKEALPIIRHHHEAVDGSGYPDGLKGDEIPLAGRVLNLVDSYEAMISERPHRKAMDTEAALEALQRHAGTIYDTGLVKSFVEFIRKQDDQAKASADASKHEGDAARDIVENIAQEIKKGNIELPVLPTIVREVESVINDPVSTVKHLAAVIEKDAVISLKLIAVANSPIYRGVKEIKSLKHAIPRIGVKETRNVVSAIVNRGLYISRNRTFRTTLENLWLHSLATAYCAREIAEKLDLPDSDRYFLLGLIHDIGKVLLVKTVSQSLGLNETIDMEVAMKSVQEMHCSFGAALLRRWNFDAMFVRVATLHEAKAFTENTEKEILVVHLANLMTRNLGFSLIKEEAELLDAPSIPVLSMDPSLLPEVAASVKGLMADAGKIF